MKIFNKISLGFLAFFMLVPGLEKFTDKFSQNFIEQIALSNLPFPTLSRFMGQGGEIVTGLILFYMLFFSKKITSDTYDKLFKLTHILMLAILGVAMYVHFHPAVPAEILPFEEKKPYLTVVMLVLVFLNIFIFKNKKEK